MSKVERLQEAARRFETEIALAAASDAGIAALRHELAPLFVRIARGLVEPPAAGLYQKRLHSEDETWGLGTALFSAESDFISALEDWRSKPWYPR